MITAIIPARGGSKRIPRKNIKPFLGIPIIQRVIELAAKSEIFCQIVVSTDDIEVATLAEAAGAAIPFIRPVDLAGDFVGTLDVIKHTALQLGLDKTPDSKICCLYPTSIFVSKDDLMRGVDKLSISPESFVVSVGQVSDSRLLRGYIQCSDNSFKPLFSDYRDSRTQDLPKIFVDAGQFYLGTTEVWLKSDLILNANITPVEMAHDKFVDIDIMEDWNKAESLFQQMFIRS